MRYISKLLLSLLIGTFIISSCKNDDDVPTGFVGLWVNKTDSVVNTLTLKSDKSGEWVATEKGLIAGKAYFTWRIKGNLFISKYDDGNEESETYSLKEDTLYLNKSIYIKQLN